MIPIYPPHYKICDTNSGDQPGSIGGPQQPNSCQRRSQRNTEAGDRDLTCQIAALGAEHLPQHSSAARAAHQVASEPRQWD